MDCSKIPFGTEGCSSSESGWTMYIDSPMQEDDMECYNEEDDIKARKSNYNYGIQGGYDDIKARKSNYNYGIQGGYDDIKARKSNYEYGIHGGYNKEDSDDSMASDASSGPSHQHKRANAESSQTMASSKHGKSGQFKKLFSWKKSNEKEKKSVEHSSKHKHKNDAHKQKKYFK